METDRQKVDIGRHPNSKNKITFRITNRPATRKIGSEEDEVLTGHGAGSCFASVGFLRMKIENLLLPVFPVPCFCLDAWKLNCIVFPFQYFLTFSDAEPRIKNSRPIKTIFYNKFERLFTAPKGRKQYGKTTHGTMGSFTWSPENSSLIPAGVIKKKSCHCKIL